MVQTTQLGLLPRALGKLSKNLISFELTSEITVQILPAYGLPLFLKAIFEG